MLLIITGLSGAGKSTALHALEDAGFFCTDNLPVTMLADWAENVIQQKSNAAVGIDIRSSENPELLHLALTSIREGLNWKMIYIEAEDEILQRRFSTVRRLHPHLPHAPLAQAVESERLTLTTLKNQADIVFDSSNLTPYQLSDLVENFWKKQRSGEAETQKIVCTVVSFSYQRGLPTGADVVFDMRFLPNPHYDPELAPLTGKDEPVQTFLNSCPETKEAEQHIRAWLSFVWPNMIKERKRYFTIGFGCSGGRHRSVYMTEIIAQWLGEQNMCVPMIRHRELGDIR